MLLDASAIVAILAEEPEAEAFIGAIEAANGLVTTPVAVFEAVLGLARIRRLRVEEAEEIVRGFLDAVTAEVAPIDRLDAAAAIDAHRRYGKGRGHPASLNLGDCFAYGAARRRGLALLFKGDDFPQTDIRPAVSFDRD
mgnify:CR=1 FL=1